MLFQEVGVTNFLSEKNSFFLLEYYFYTSCEQYIFVMILLGASINRYFNLSQLKMKTQKMTKNLLPPQSSFISYLDNICFSTVIIVIYISSYSK